MKIAITGHTSGLGKTLFDVLSAKHEVQGFSRSTGYDISSDIDKITLAIKDFDVLINNAYHEIGQLTLLQKMYKTVWRDQDKLIMHVGSFVAHKKTNRPDIESSYIQSKIQQKTFIENFCNFGTLPYVTYIAPSAMDTPMVSNLSYPSKMDTKAIALAFTNVLELSINSS